MTQTEMERILMNEVAQSAQYWLNVIKDDHSYDIKLAAINVLETRTASLKAVIEEKKQLQDAEEPISGDF